MAHALHGEFAKDAVNELSVDRIHEERGLGGEERQLPLPAEIVTSPQEISVRRTHPPSPLSLKIRMTFATNGMVPRPNFQGEGELNFGFCTAIKF